MRSISSSSNIVALIAAAIALRAGAPLLSIEPAQTRADTVVRTVQAPRYPGVAPLVEELSIGVADGGDEYILGQVADIALGRDGSLYVFDGQVPIVRHYDANGKFLRRIGRAGSGPGEYRSVSGLATLSDGRLLVWDTGNWRVNVYAPNGDFSTQWITPSGMSGGGTAQYSRAIMVDTAGRIIMRKQIINFREPGNQPTVWLRYRQDGTFIDTVRAPVLPSAALLTARNGNASTAMPVPFSPIRVATVSPLGSLVAGFPSRYAFEIHQPDGRTVSIRRDARAEPVSRSERSEARTSVEERMRQTDPNWSWSGPDIPDHKPFYHGLVTGLDGRIWVNLTPNVRTGPGVSGSVWSGGGNAPGRRPSAAEPPKASLYDVFEPDGSYLGQVQVPAGAYAMVRRGDHVWGVATGDDDVPRVKRYRINWRR
jgi:hypothetical protein